MPQVHSRCTPLELQPKAHQRSLGHKAIHPPHRRLAYLYGLPASTPMTRQPTKGREQRVTGVTNARLYSFNVIGCVDAS